jgi:triacylglycerol esterase/lipase EstA (alpha/beta hydrolase family)
MCLQSDKYVLPKNKRTTVSYMHQIVKNNRRKIIFDDFNRNGNQLNA